VPTVPVVEGWRSWRRFVKFLDRKSERCYRSSGMEIDKLRNLTGPAGKSLPANRFIRLNMALDTSHVGPLLQQLRLNIPHTISPYIVRSFGDDRWKNDHGTLAAARIPHSFCWVERFVQCSAEDSMEHGYLHET
jgi:hypothetical protein